METARGALLGFLPRGYPLPAADWQSRHRVILGLLALHVPIVLAFAWSTGHDPLYGLAAASIVGAVAAVAALPRLWPARWERTDRWHRSARATVAGFGLVASSAILVQLSGGMIEMHFHFFVMVAVMALYQDWPPFLMAVAFVAAHHGVTGVVAPHTVYNHASAVAHPWRWAAVHAFFILCASAAAITAWRFSEEARSRAEAANLELHGALSLQRATIESAAEGILVIDRSGRITSHNARFADMWRLPADVLASGDDARAMNAVLDQLEDPAAFVARVQALYADPMAESFDVLQFRDGRVFERSSAPQMLDGKPVGRVWAFRDVTAQKRGEESLRRSQASLAQAQHLARLGSWEYDPRAQVGSMSDEMRTLLGLAPGSPVPTFEGYLASVHPDDRAMLQDTLDRLLREGGTFSLDHRVARPGGDVAWIHAEGRAVTDDAGAPLRLVGICQDITERRRLEAREQEVHALQEMAQFKTNFLRTAAHELGTPLTPLRIQVRLLRDRLSGEGDDANGKSMRIVERNLQRLDILVKDLLESARLQSGRIRLRPRPMDLVDVAHDAVESFQQSAIEGGIRLDLDAPPVAPLAADPDRVAQVLYNFLSNAMRFTPRGGRIAVHVQETPEWVEVAVEDTGSGFDPAKAAQLFQPFTQLHDTMETTKGGNGLGLYICKGIVEQHGGQVEGGSSGPGRGARFAFRLPRAAAAHGMPAGEMADGVAA